MTNKLPRVAAMMAQHKAAKANSFSFTTQKTHIVNDEVASAVVLIPRVFHDRINEENLAKAVEVAMPGMRYCRNSIRPMSNLQADKELFGVFVRRNQRVTTMEQASADGFVAMNDTVFQDKNDDIWTVQSDGGNSFLVATVAEDIEAMLQSVRTRSIATASVPLSLEEDFGEGMIVRYYDINEEAMADGIAANGSHIYNPVTDRLVNVEAAYALVVNNDRVKPAPSVEVASKDKDLLGYMKSLYGHNKEFFAQIKKLIDAAMDV